MPVKLLVTRTTDDSSPDEYIFDRDTITIGRDAASHLTLPDLKRVVSKRHAELRRHKGTYQIVDLGSKNFTFLNDERLQSSRPYDLKYGDLIRIGDFEIRLEPELTSKPDHDGTVFDVNFVNPFAENAAKLTDALRGIRDAFEHEAPSRREDALRDALHETFIAGNVRSAPPAGAGKSAVPADAGKSAPPADAGKSAPPADAGKSALPRDDRDSDRPHEAFVLIARLLAPYAPAPEPAQVSKATDEVLEAKPAPGPARPETPARSPTTRASSPAMENRLDALLDILIKAAARLVNIPWQFRHEFIGQTIMQSTETASIFSGDAEALREYLLDARIPADEAERRRQALADAADDVVRHQVAMMDGYKAGAHQGTERLLEEFDPAGVEAAVRTEDGLSRLIPPLAKIRALDRLKQKMHELKGQDWSVAERRIFRPAFIKAYLARMTSLRK